MRRPNKLATLLIPALIMLFTSFAEVLAQTVTVTKTITITTRVPMPTFVTLTATTTVIPPTASVAVWFGLGFVTGAIVAGIFIVLRSGRAVERGSKRRK